MTILATVVNPAVVPTVAVTASSGGVAAPPPVNGEAGLATPQTAASSGPPLPSARSRWKKLTGTAMFINRLGKTMQATRILRAW